MFFQTFCAEKRQSEPRISTSMESLILTGPGDFHTAFSNRKYERNNRKKPFGFYAADRIPFAHTFSSRLQIACALHMEILTGWNGSSCRNLYLFCVGHGN